MKWKLKKNKNELNPMAMNYTTWESDLGFLTYTINRKLLIYQSYRIAPFSQQLVKNNDFIKDTDIDDIYNEVVSDIYNSLSQQYKSFLIVKYFGNDKQLIEYISENVLDYLSKSATKENNDKISKMYSAKTLKTIEKLNHINKVERVNKK